MSLLDKLRPMLCESILLERDSNIEKIDILKELFDAIVRSSSKDLKTYYEPGRREGKYDAVIGFDPYELTSNPIYKYTQSMESDFYTLKPGSKSEYIPITDRVIVLFKYSHVYGGVFQPETGHIIITIPRLPSSPKNIDEFLFQIPNPSFKDLINNLRGVKQSHTGLLPSAGLLMHEVSHLITHKKSEGNASKEYHSIAAKRDSNSKMSVDDKFKQYVNMHDEIESELTSAIQSFLLNNKYDLSNTTFETFKNGVMKNLYQHTKGLYNETSLKKIYNQLYTIYSEISSKH